MNDAWRDFFRMTFGTPIRAALSTLVLITLIITGAIGMMVSAIINEVLAPLAILAVMIALIVFIAKGGKR